MGCYSDKTKHCCSKIVLLASALMAIMGVIAVIFGFMQTGKVPELNDAAKKAFNVQGLDSAGQGIGKFNIGVGIVVAMIGVLGCILVKFKNPFLAIPYGLLSFVATILFLIVTIITFMLSSQTGQDAIYNAACGKEVTLGVGDKSKTF